MIRKKSVRTVIEEAGAFVALATVLMAHWGIPALQARGLALGGYLVTAILAVACIGVVYDRLSKLSTV